MERCGRLTMMTFRRFGVAASTVSGFPVRLGLMVSFLTDGNEPARRQIGLTCCYDL